MKNAFSNIKFEDILRDRILENIHKYFPDTDSDNFKVRSIPNTFRSNNPIYLFEVSKPRHNFKKIIVAKHLLPEITSPDAPEREYEILSTFYGKNEMVKVHLFVPRPLDRFSDLRTILTEKVEGINFLDLIKKKNKIFSPTALKELMLLFHRCGECLKTLHDVTETGESGTLSDELYIKITDTYNYLLEKNVLDRGYEKIFLEKINQSMERIGNSRFKLVRLHRDYGFNNLIIKDNDIYIIDFAFSKEGFIFFDISTFLTAFDTLNPYPKNILFNFSNIGLYKRAFLKGYFGDLNLIKELDWLLIHLYKIRSLLIHCRRRYDKFFLSNLKGRIYFLILRPFYKSKIRKEIEELSKFL